MADIKKIFKKIIHWLPIIGIVCLLIFVLYGYRLGIFQSTQTFQHFIQQFGDYAVVAFIILQIIQVVVPILPGGITTVAGMLMFGNVYGLIYSCVGLVAGEAIGFILVRNYGTRFARFILPPKQFEKFETVLQKQSGTIRRFLIATFLIPFAPDDIACLVAGMSNISFREFMRIVFILKPWSVTSYGLIMLYLFRAAKKL